MPSSFGAALRDLAAALARLGVRYYVIGAQAAIFYGSTRVTEDIDVTVHLGERSAKELARALERGGLELRFGGGDAFVERTRVLPFLHTATRIPVDVVLAGPGIEEEFLARAKRVRRAGVLVPVASAEDVVVMKVLAQRPRDWEDIRAVLRALGPSLDVAAIVETLARLDEALGQSDLVPAFERARDEAAKHTAPKPRAGGAKTHPKPRARPPRRRG